MLWVGIDEAGYGPNLGPLVMSAVIAEGPETHPPDVWADLAETVCRAGGSADKLWVDDSKAVFKARKERKRLDHACYALIDAAGRPVPQCIESLFQAIQAGSLAEVELAPWVENSDPFNSADLKPAAPFQGANWRIIDVKSVVMGPSRFNARLDVHRSKASVHFEAFIELLSHVWNLTGQSRPASVRSDKHGARNYYWDNLVQAFPEVWIDRGVEGPELSVYALRSNDRRLDLRLEPKADAGDGLVALASLVSKAVRERWMDVFNAYWIARFPDLKPTAGYPGDAARFREVIEPACQAQGLPLDAWWRRK